jgi:HlyD family secretion protein
VKWGLPAHKGPDVISAVATRGNLVINVTERGELESSKSTTLNCEVEGGGKLATIVPEGTRVKKDEEIARFDTDVLQKGINEQEVKWETADGKMKAAASEVEVQRNKGEQEVAKAKNALDLATIALEAYKDGEYPVEVEKRKAELDLAKKELKEAEDSLDFTRGMVKKGFAQMEQIRAMELNKDSKHAKVRQQEADLNHMEKNVRRMKVVELEGKLDDARRELDRAQKSLKSTVEKAESEQSAARKTAALEQRELDRLRAQLGKCVVKAPQGGIVIYAKRYYWDDATEIRPGAQLHFQQPIVTLPDLDRMQVKLRVHESVVKKVKKDQPATLQVDALPGQVLHGKVVSVATQAQSQWRSSVKEYETIVSVDDLPADAGLRPGMTAEVKVLLKTVPDALTVPVQAVTEFDGKHIAYVVTPNGVERREVKVGDSNEQLVQILEGVAEGERVAQDARSRAAAELKAAGGSGEKKDGEKDKKDDKEKKDPSPSAAPPVAAPAGG